MTLQEELRKAIAILSRPMPEDELANGWTKESWSAMAKSFIDLNARLEANQLTEKDLALNYPRGLDSWGVHGGPVYDLATGIHLALRQFLKGINARG